MIVACTLRSGSNLLCELLTLHGFGVPTEYFQEERYENPISLRQAAPASLLTLAEVRAEIAARHANAAWLGVKWNWRQYETFMDALRRTTVPAETFEHWFPAPRWIRLSRRRLIDQAVSLYVAQRRGVWVYGDLAQEITPIEYDFETLYRNFEDLATEEALWADHFARSSAEPLHLFYEDLVARPDAVFRQVAAYLDPKRAPPAEAVTLEVLNSKPLGSPLNRELSDRFAEDLTKEKRPARSQALANAIDCLVSQMQGAERSTVFQTFLGDHRGRSLRVHKLDITKVGRFVGGHAIVEQAHFLDGAALRIDPGGHLELKVRGSALMIEFLMHSWSGQARVTTGSTEEIVDLFHTGTATRPVLLRLDPAGAARLKIAPTGERNALAQGNEVWLQRIWTLSGDAMTWPPG